MEKEEKNSKYEKSIRSRSRSGKANASSQKSNSSDSSTEMDQGTLVGQFHNGLKRQREAYNNQKKEFKVQKKNPDN